MAFARGWRRSAAARCSTRDARAAASACRPDAAPHRPPFAAPGLSRTIRGGAKEAMNDTDASGPDDEPVKTRARAAPPRLKRRAEFQRAARGRRTHSAAFLLQSLTRPDGAPYDEARFGFTVTRKIGNAVVRNRIRRRLKEALRLAGLEARADHDYVIVARIEALGRPFEALMKELARALRAAHSPGGKSASRSKADDRDRLR